MLSGGFRFGAGPGGGGAVAAPPRVSFVAQVLTNALWTNMPAGLTEFRGETTTRQWTDLSGARQARLTARIITAGFAGAEFLARFQTADGGAFAELASVAGEGDVLIDAAATVKTAWFDLAAAAKADVILSLWGQGGDGITDPAFGVIGMEFRT